MTAAAPTEAQPLRPAPHLRLVPSRRETTPARDFEQPELPLTFCLPNGLPAVPVVSDLVVRHPHSSVVPWAARLAQAVLEVVAGERPVLQLTSWVHPDIYRRLERRHRLGAHERDTRRTAVRHADTVRSVHVCHPAEGVAEVSVVTAGADRCRALAMRLERRKGRWFCTELDWA